MVIRKIYRRSSDSSFSFSIPFCGLRRKAIKASMTLAFALVCQALSCPFSANFGSVCAGQQTNKQTKRIKKTFLLSLFSESFRVRDLNPGLSGESRLSWPTRLTRRNECRRQRELSMKKKNTKKKLFALHNLRRCSMAGSNRWPWVHKTHALPTAPMER